MQIKTIKKIIVKKLEEWLETIDNEALRKEVRDNIVLSGGSIASMLLQQPVNDYDIYIQDMDVLIRLVKYYTPAKELAVYDGRKKKEYTTDLEEQYHGSKIDEIDSQLAIFIRTLKEDQVKILTTGSEVKYPAGKEIPPYSPLFFSPNAISLSNDIQIVNRFHGTPEEIHKTFDFIHATNYFTFKDGIVRNQAALESLLTKRLSYQGSLYPLTSVIRSKKFVQRGWTIGAGEYLKMLFQVSELDLTDPDVLEDQLIGVDVAYFDTIISILRGKYNSDKNFKITSEYLSVLIEQVFND